MLSHDVRYTESKKYTFNFMAILPVYCAPSMML